MTSAPGPYLSAMDLPSFVEMQQLLRGGKLLTLVLGRKHRPGLLEIERQLQRMGNIVDDFYALLGPRNWVFHERLHLDNVEAIVTAGLAPEEAERRFIGLYQDREWLSSMVRSLYRFEELRIRRHLIERALADYEAGRYSATTLVLIGVMDGFVNDFESRRKGLHARSPEDMQAWDSVVGHHLGLSNAHQSFTKSTGRTTDAETFELHRNGIVHGTIINFDNDVVATKAWNRLFAVVDWATSRQRQDAPKEEQPSWRELAERLLRNQRDKEALERWQPSTLTPTDEGFKADAVYLASRYYLTAWQQRNYGAMARALPKLLSGSTLNETAGMVRGDAELFPLTSFTIDRVIDGEAKPGRMRWIREDASDQPATPGTLGEWHLFLWGPMAILNRANGNIE